MLDILALFRHRRASRPGARSGNDAGTTTNRQRAVRQRRQPPRGRAAKLRIRRIPRIRLWGLKSYSGRMVVNWARAFLRPPRRGSRPAGPQWCAGKTTAFYRVMNLIKADRAKIELDGYDVTHLPMYQRARLGIGYLPQEASIFRGLNVEDNILAASKWWSQTGAVGMPISKLSSTSSRSPAIARPPRCPAGSGRVEIARRAGKPPLRPICCSTSRSPGIDPKAVVEIQRLVPTAYHPRHRRSHY